MQTKITGHTAHLLADVLGTCVKFDYPASYILIEREHPTERFQHYSQANNTYDAHRVGFFSYENGNIVVFPDCPAYAAYRQTQTIKAWRELAVFGSAPEMYQTLLEIIGE